MTARPNPATAAAAAGVFATAVVSRMERQYRDHDTFTPATVALLYSAYAADGAAFGWAARKRTWPLPLPATPACASGTAVASAGAGVAAIAMTRFGSSAQISGVEPGTLHTSGLYRYSRNPQYLGLVATLAGISLATRSGLAAAITTGAFAVLNQWIKSEEAHLTRIFGDDYETYRSSTRRWL